MDVYPRALGFHIQSLRIRAAGRLLDRPIRPTNADMATTTSVDESQLSVVVPHADLSYDNWQQKGRSRGCEFLGTPAAGGGYSRGGARCPLLLRCTTAAARRPRLPHHNAATAVSAAPTAASLPQPRSHLHTSVLSTEKLRLQNKSTRYAKLSDLLDRFDSLRRWQRILHPSVPIPLGQRD